MITFVSCQLSPTKLLNVSTPKLKYLKKNKKTIFTLSKDAQAKYPVTNKRAYSAGEYRKILTKELNFYTYGVLEYDDIFGETHSTKFCFVLDDYYSNEFSFYADYNEFD